MEPITLDQLRVFVAVVEARGFSAAARRLHRAQSAISYAIANLERLLAVRLFDRTGRLPTLTPEGEELLVEARTVLAQADRMLARAHALQAGTEATLALAVDVLYPMAHLVDVLRAFNDQWPDVSLRLHTEALGAVPQLVHDGICDLGIGGPIEDEAMARGLERRAIDSVQMVPVAGASHPLTRAPRPIPSARLAGHVQIVLSERGPKAGTVDRGVLSPRTWRVADLETKQLLLVTGFGWGNMPEHRVGADLAAQRLIRLDPEAWSPEDHRIGMYAIFRRDAPPGPAGRWLLDHLRESRSAPQERPTTST